MEIRLYSYMAKLFLDEIPQRYAQVDSVSGFINESICFQLAYRCDQKETFRIRFNKPCPARMYKVHTVAVQLPVYPDTDMDYLRDKPGLYPDFLDAFSSCRLLNADQKWRSVFFELEPWALDGGTHQFEIQIVNASGEILCGKTIIVRVIDAVLADHGLMYTRWFHCDSLSSYYNVPVFSEAHWKIIGHFVQKAVQRGMNMILTPVHTPPLDTDVGAYRQTVQLVKVTRNDETHYEFDFAQLDRWIHLCESCGIRYFEMAHLYTQWGAAAAPKIVAQTPEGEVRIFGWDTPACGPAYKEFLAQYLTALTEHLELLGIAGRCYFHISDEPTHENKDAYASAKQQVSPYLRGFPVIDALSHVSLWDEGLVNRPVVATDAIEAFLMKNVPSLWAYYCCAQYREVSNGFVAMPGERTRILGAQLYKFQIAGFLQWGYNYYFSRNSRCAVNPYRTCDGDGCWPAGDPFVVYPSPDGFALDSLRHILMQKALDDLRALKLLETVSDREYVLSFLDRTLGKELSFSVFPRNEKALTDFRSALEYEIIQRL